MIETVLGPIAPEELGVTMCHEHLAIDLCAVRGDTDSTLSPTDPVAQELEKLYALGCRAVIEVTCNDMGRRVERLRRYSLETGLHVVASTGFYLRPYHTPWLLEASQEEVEELFVTELTSGIEKSGIRAGLIAEIATGRDEISPSEHKVFVAAAAASRRVGAAVSTHCDMGRLGHRQLELLLGGGMQPDKVILGHTDLLPHSEYHIELLRHGINLAFDTIGKESYLSDEQRADNLAALLEKGYEDHLLLSQDVSRRSYLTAAGGKGYTAVLGGFTALLAKRGVGGRQLEKLLVHNPARILDRG